MDLKVKDVAELLHLSEITIRRWVQEGKIPAYRLDQHIFFSRQEIENWMLCHSSRPCTLPNPTDPMLQKKFRGSQQFSLYRSIHQGHILRLSSSRFSHGWSKEKVLEEAAHRIAKYLHADGDVLTELLLEREKLMPTALNHGIAVPHTRDTLFQQNQDKIFVLFLEEPIVYGALDGKLVHTLFFLFASHDKRHLHLLAKIAHLSQQPQAVAFLETRPTKELLLTFIKEWEAEVPQKFF